MKRVIFLFVFFSLCFSTFSQKVPPQDIKAESQMLLQAKAKNGFMIQFTGFRIPFVDSVAREFMSKKINMVHADESKKELGNRVFKFYVRYTSRKNIEDEVHFEYTLVPGGSFFYVKDLIIYGDLDDVVDFYNEFWDKSAKKGELKGGKVVIHEYLKDKISLSYNTEEKAAFIKIIP